MSMTKTVKARILKPTKTKKQRLNYLYQEWNQNVKDYLRGQSYEERREKYDLNSAYVQDAKQLKIKGNLGKQPIYIRSQSIKIQKTNNELTEYFASIPIDSYERIWIPIKIPEEQKNLLMNGELKDSKIVKDKEKFFLNLTIELTSSSYKSRGVLGIDPGSRWLGVGVCGSDNKPFFIGKQIRTTRKKYQHLRKQTQEKGIDSKFKDKESCKVDDLMHKATKWLAEYAEKNKLTIVVGDVKGINRDTEKGRNFNRRVNTMPTHKFKEYLKYKCEERGVPFLLIDEAYTTQTCSNCGEKVGRPSSKEFKCSNCGLVMHADRNGAINIKERGLDKLEIEPMSESGASLAMPKTPEPDINYAE